MTDEQIKTPVPVQNDRILAALAHVMILMPMMGIIASIVIYVTQKDKSRFVAFQAIQAVAYQLVLIMLWFVGMGCYMCSFFGVFLAIPLSSSAQHISPAFPETFMILPFLVFGGIGICALALIVYGFIAAAMTFQGRDFRYIFLGDWLERYLQEKKE